MQEVRKSGTGHIRPLAVHHEHDAGDGGEIRQRIAVEVHDVQDPIDLIAPIRRRFNCCATRPRSSTRQRPW
jgi:hypothetical protein